MEYCVSTVCPATLRLRKLVLEWRIIIFRQNLPLWYSSSVKHVTLHETVTPGRVDITCVRSVLQNFTSPRIWNNPKLIDERWHTIFNILCDVFLTPVCSGIVFVREVKWKIPDEAFCVSVWSAGMGGLSWGRHLSLAAGQEYWPWGCPLSPCSLVPLSLCVLCSVGQERFQSPKTPQERDCETWANGLADLSAWRFLAWECKINEFIIFILKNYPSPLSSNSYPERSKIANFNTFLMWRMLVVDPSNHSYNFQWTGKICYQYSVQF